MNVDETVSIYGHTGGTRVHGSIDRDLSHDHKEVYWSSYIVSSVVCFEDHIWNCRRDFELILCITILASHLANMTRPNFTLSTGIDLNFSDISNKT